MKKILFLTNIPAPYTVDFYNKIGKKIELTVLYERDTAKGREKSWLKNINENFIAIYMWGIAVSDDLGFCPGVIRHLKKLSYDLVVVGDYSSPTGMLALFYMKKKKLPYYIHIDGGLIKNDNKAIFSLKKKLLTGASGYMSSGLVSDKYLLHYGADKEKIYHYPFTSIYEKDVISRIRTKDEKMNMRIQIGKGEMFCEKFIVVSVGSIIHGKGFDILLKAATKFIENTGVYIIGGQISAELQKIIEESQLKNVHFLPFMAYSKLKDYLELSDLFVHPTRHDVWGLVINEAMAAGLPIVTTDKCVAGLELIKEGENGYIVQAENSEAIADKVIFLKNNKELLNKMGENNRKKIAHYTLEIMAEKYCDALKI